MKTLAWPPTVQTPPTSPLITLDIHSSRATSIRIRCTRPRRNHPSSPSMDWGRRALSFPLPPPITPSLLLIPSPIQRSQGGARRLPSFPSRPPHLPIFLRHPKREPMQVSGRGGKGRGRNVRRIPVYKG